MSETDTGQKNLRNYFIELLIVTFGILIAFGLNNWNESRKEKQLVQLHLSGLKEELQENREELQIAYDYHVQLADKLNNSPEEAKLVLNPANIKNSSWKLAENDIFKKHVDHDLYKILNQIYHVHEKLEKYADNATSLINEINIKSPFYKLPMIDKSPSKENIRSFSASIKNGWFHVFESWMSAEEYYISLIDQALKIMNEPV